MSLLLLQLSCLSGYDGGLPQSFILEAKDSHTLAVVAKIQVNIEKSKSTSLLFFNLNNSDTESQA